MSREWTTYRLANGELIYGEYGWVENPEFFDDVDKPVEVIMETWELRQSETITYKPPWWDNADEEKE